MIGAIVRHETGGGFAIDTVIIATGLVVMALLAWALDARRPSPPSRHGVLTPATSV
jgi:hypothetical protein